MEFVTVNTEHGPVNGIQKTSVLDREYVSFQGIPYMRAPVGKLRFRDPELPEKWVEPLDASQETSSYCFHHPGTSSKGGKEDAGVLNVYVPVTGSEKLLPVIAFIHGGGFQMGSSSPDVYGPDFFMQKDVVLVTMNYRIGAMGFLSLNDPCLGVPGNAGLKDQVVALKWIQKNIENFGGNRNNVTLLGDGAGGAAAHYHMISEQSNGLFHKAIVMSGCAFNKTWALPPKRNFAHRLGKKLGWNESGGDKKLLETLENADPFELMKQSLANNILTEQEFSEFFIYAFGPVIEPYLSSSTFIHKDPVLMAQDAWSKDISCIIGATSFEGAFSLIFEKKEQFIEVFEKANYFAPLTELNIDVDNGFAARFGTRIKKIYFEYAHLCNTNYELFCQYTTDRHFWHGIQNVVKSRVSVGGSGKTYLYRFDASTRLNVMKNYNNIENYSGATHGDMTFYMFSPAYVAPPSIETKEFEIMTKVITMLTNFSSTGNPNDSELKHWEPVTSAKPPLNCLNISEKKNELISLPESDRLMIWDTIYKDARVELF